MKQICNKEANFLKRKWGNNSDYYDQILCKYDETYTKSNKGKVWQFDIIILGNMNLTKN